MHSISKIQLDSWHLSEILYASLCWISTTKQDTAIFNQLLIDGKYLLQQGYIYLGKKDEFWCLTENILWFSALAYGR